MFYCHAACFVPFAPRPSSCTSFTLCVCDFLFVFVILRTTAAHAKAGWQKVHDKWKEGLTVGKRSKQHPETAETARFIGPHPHNSHTGVQHDVIGYCATKLGLQRNHTSLYCPPPRRSHCVVSPTPRSVGQLLRIGETGRGTNAGPRRWLRYLQVLDGAAAIVNRHKVLLALVGIFHLILQESQVDLERANKAWALNSVHFPCCQRPKGPMTRDPLALHVILSRCNHSYSCLRVKWKWFTLHNM